MKNTITSRAITPDDEDFLFRLYASTREEELAQTTWTSTEIDSFLKQQFSAQHQFYMQQFSQATFEIILADNKSVGRLYVDRRKDEIRLIDIALLPEYRNKGIGTSLLRKLLEEAGEIDKPLRIHVEKFNPALQLYQRLGFKKIDDVGVYYFMEWKS